MCDNCLRGLPAEPLRVREARFALAWAPLVLDGEPVDGLQVEVDEELVLAFCSEACLLEFLGGGA